MKLGLTFSVFAICFTTIIPMKWFYVDYLGYEYTMPLLLVFCAIATALFFGVSYIINLFNKVSGIIETESDTRRAYSTEDIPDNLRQAILKEAEKMRQERNGSS